MPCKKKGKSGNGGGDTKTKTIRKVKHIRDRKAGNSIIELKEYVPDAAQTDKTFLLTLATCPAVSASASKRRPWKRRAPLAASPCAPPGLLPTAAAEDVEDDDEKDTAKEREESKTEEGGRWRGGEYSG